MIGNAAPDDPALRSNWLPVGTEAIYLIIRSYDPKQHEEDEKAKQAAAKKKG